VLLAARIAPTDALSRVGAEIAAAAWHSYSPTRAMRATDEIFTDLCLLNRYQRFGDDEASGTGAFQQVIEDLERQRQWLRALGEPHRYQSLASELGRPPNSPDHNRLAGLDDSSPNASRAIYKHFPLNRFQELVEKFKSLDPGLTRPQQCAAVRNSPEFAEYHLTDRILREAAKVVAVRRGRPRKQKQT
jgi:hypothetical protein